MSEHTVIDLILAKHKPTPPGRTWPGMSCRECHTPAADPCDVQELGHEIGQLRAELAAAKVLIAAARMESKP